MNVLKKRIFILYLTQAMLKNNIEEVLADLYLSGLWDYNEVLELDEWVENNKLFLAVLN